jgi:hypothetical protein
MATGLPTTRAYSRTPLRSGDPLVQFLLCKETAKYLIPAPSSAEPASYLANGHARLPLRDNRAQRFELAVVEEEVAAFSSGGRQDEPFPQVVIEMGAGESGRGAEIAGHVEAGEGRSIRRGRDDALGQITRQTVLNGAIGDAIVEDGCARNW